MNSNDHYLHHLSYLPKIYNLLKARAAEPHICTHCRGKLEPTPASIPSPEPPATPKTQLPPVPSPAAESPKIYRRQDVLERTKISVGTYYRHIDRGILVPRECAFTGKKYYLEEDLEKAIEYSRIHGYL